MADIQYKAFISYSHADEKWARWLHRQLESYRVPKRLAGQPGSHGVVPSKLSPVFRDRDELSSGSNLSDKILKALEQSDALIVLCSAASATSLWVNEEIRQFRALGRNDRIFCVLVDGESTPTADNSKFFPPALFEHDEESHFEPLAADPRKWGDGKYLAKLKLIAGLLGVRLDELRQRDLIRRRKWQAVAALGAVAAMALAALTISSTISRHLEREKAEQLATFIVDLGERMQADVDLETLGIISQEAARYLGGLDLEKISPEISVKVGLVFRQLAYVSDGEGRSEEALEAYEQSRDLFRELYEQYPEDQNILFELGQAEFYVGNWYFQMGDYAAARPPLENYLQVSHALIESDPANPEWILELSYAITGRVAVQLESGQGVTDSLLEDVGRAVSLMESALEQTPEDLTLTDYYATTLAWAADAQLEACNLDDAEESRRKVLELATEATRSDPSNNNFKMGQAFALSGLSNVLYLKGYVDEAETDLLRSIEILGELSAADPSNAIHRRDLLLRRFALATIYSDTERLEQAREIMGSIEPDMKAPVDAPIPTRAALIDYIDFLLAYAELEYRMGNEETASAKLDEAIAWLTTDSPSIERNFLFDQRSVQARFLWWELKKNGLFDPFPGDVGSLMGPSSTRLSCENADLEARVAVMNGDEKTASDRYDYLVSRSYSNPSFIKFCRKYNLCS